MRRTGLTVVELAVAAVVSALACGVAYGLWAGGAQMTGRVVEHSDAVRSALLATEALRADLARMVVDDPEEDLALTGGGSGITFLVAKRVDGDAWTLAKEPVTYTLEPVGTSGARRLMREANGAKRAIADCLLEHLAVRIVEQDQGDGAALEITVVGLGSTRASTRYVACVRVPLNTIVEPEGYALSGGRS